MFEQREANWTLSQGVSIGRLEAWGGHFRGISPLLADPTNSLDVNLGTDQRVQLVQEDQNPEEVAADGRQDDHRLYDTCN